MAQTETYIKGIAKWVKVFPGQEDKKYKFWGLDLYLDESQKEAFKNWDCELTLRDSTFKGYTETEGYPYWIKLKRSTMKLIKDKVVNFDPPEVLGPDNTKWSGAAIGNGSEVTCKVVVYDTMKGKGVRLEAVRVDVHVPYAEKEVDTSNVDSPF